MLDRRGTGGGSAVRFLAPVDFVHFRHLTPSWFRHLLRRLPRHRSALAVGAYVDDRPVGLLLARQHRTDTCVEIVHLALEANAHHLLEPMIASAEDRIQRSGVGRITIRFSAEEEWSDRGVRLVVTMGWTRPHTLFTYSRADLTHVCDEVPWLRIANRDVNKALRIVPWRSVSLASIADLFDEHRNHRIWEPGLGPTLDVDADVSLAVQHDTRPIGWLLLSRRRRGLLYNRLFVRHEHRGRGLGAILIARALTRHAREEPTTRAFAHGLASRSKMLRFYRRHVRPHADESTWYSSTRRLV